MFGWMVEIDFFFIDRGDKDGLVLDWYGSFSLNLFLVYLSVNGEKIFGVVFNVFF